MVKNSLSDSNLKKFMNSQEKTLSVQFYQYLEIVTLYAFPERALHIDFDRYYADTTGCENFLLLREVYLGNVSVEGLWSTGSSRFFGLDVYVRKPVLDRFELKRLHGLVTYITKIYEDLQRKSPTTTTSGKLGYYASAMGCNRIALSNYTIPQKNNQKLVQYDIPVALAMIDAMEKSIVDGSFYMTCLPQDPFLSL